MRSRFGSAALFGLLVWLSTASAWADMPHSAAQYRDEVIRFSRLYLPHVRPSWIAGQIHQESRWNATAKSKVGAAGLMQIMPGTRGDVARWCQLPGFDPLNPRRAIEGGICLDAWMWRFAIRSLPGWTGTVHDKAWLMWRGFNGGPGYLPRETRVLESLGLMTGPAVWLGSVCSEFRSAANCHENVTYPQLILKWARLYAGWD